MTLGEKNQKRQGEVDDFLFEKVQAMSGKVQDGPRATRYK